MRGRHCKMEPTLHEWKDRVEEKRTKRHLSERQETVEMVDIPMKRSVTSKEDEKKKTGEQTQVDICPLLITQKAHPDYHS